MHSHDEKQSDPSFVPPGYDSRLLEELENPLLMEMDDEEDDLGRSIIRSDAPHTTGAVHRRHH